MSVRVKPSFLLSNSFVGPTKGKPVIVGQGGAIISPLAIPGVLAWLTSRLGVTQSGGKVSAWADQSGNGKNASQGVAGQQPVYSASDAAYNNQPSIAYLKANSTQLNIAAFAVAQPYELIFVGNSDASLQDNIFNGGTAEAGSLTGNAYMNAGATVATGALGSVLAPSVMSFVFNGAASAIYVNDSQTAKVIGNAGAGNLSGAFAIGGVANFWTGKINEFVAFGRQLSNAERKALFQYEGSTFGIATT